MRPLRRAGIGAVPRRRALAGAAGLAGAILLAAIASGAWAWRTLRRPFQGYAGAEKLVTVPAGASGTAILGRLESEGILASAALTRLYLVHALGDPPLKAGEYRFAGPLTPAQALDRLIRGEVVTYLVTLVEGLTLEEAAAHLARAGRGDEAALLAALRDPAPIRDLDPAAADLEGYLFPDTYAFARAAPPRAIAAALVENFRRRWRAAAASLPSGDGRSPREIVTLASIVEKEARLAGERPLIAGVYANRLARGMGLFADPTVIFALKRLGRWDGNLRRPDLALEHPYNTYRIQGLPPGPICSPGAASLAAAAAPAVVPYLYFVSRNDGSHAFAATLGEHERNVETWQRAYWRERWASERAAGYGR